MIRPKEGWNLRLFLFTRNTTAIPVKDIENCQEGQKLTNNNDIIVREYSDLF